MMRNTVHLIFLWLGLLYCAISLTGCGSDGGDSVSDLVPSSLLSVQIGDAKPVLPPNTEKLLITFDEVSVHKVGGGWVSLTMPQTPYTIDLLQFADGHTTSLVPPVKLDLGLYTQIRLGVTAATLVIDGVSYPVDIPSQHLKTNIAFQFVSVESGAIDITVDFDLSRSIVVTGSGGYILKPVLHIVQTQLAATIGGRLGANTFGTSNEAKITLIWDKDHSGTFNTGDEEYTQLIVEKEGTDPTAFSIFWVIPYMSYIVQVEIDGVEIYSEGIDWDDLPAGALFILNDDIPI